MPRQNFLSSDFFVRQSEAQARKALNSIPEHLPQISLLKQNDLLQTMRFLYTHPKKHTQNYIDVSILPLDDQYVRFCLHASYINGQAFYTDADISYALAEFEQAVHAALTNDYSAFRNSSSAVTKRPQQQHTLASLAGVVFLWRKLTS